MPPTNHFITLAKAVDYTTRYRAQSNVLLEPQFRTLDVLPTCETFPKAAIEALLAEPGCVSIRVYYGLDIELKLHCILVGVNDQGEDILPQSDADGGSVIVEEGIRCPPSCPPSSPLNGG